MKRNTKYTSSIAANSKTLVLHRYLRKADRLIIHGSHRLQPLVVNKTTENKPSKNHSAGISTF